MAGDTRTGHSAHEGRYVPFLENTGWKIVQAIVRRQLFRGPPLQCVSHFTTFRENKTAQSHHHLVPSDQRAQDFWHAWYWQPPKDEYSAFFVAVEKRRENGFTETGAVGTLTLWITRTGANKIWGCLPGGRPRERLPGSAAGSPTLAPTATAGLCHLGTEKGSSWSQERGRGGRPLGQRSRCGPMDEPHVVLLAANM